MHSCNTLRTQVPAGSQRLVFALSILGATRQPSPPSLSLVLPKTLLTPKTYKILHTHSDDAQVELCAAARVVSVSARTGARRIYTQRIHRRRHKVTDHRKDCGSVFVFVQFEFTLAFDVQYDSESQTRTFTLGSMCNKTRKLRTSFAFSVYHKTNSYTRTNHEISIHQQIATGGRVRP